MATDLQRLDDEELMKHIVKGNHQAFSVLVKRHTDKFYRLSFRTLMNKAEAEDVVQNCFIKLWNKPKAYKNNGKVKFTTWFYKVIVNACLDVNRKKEVSHFHEDVEDDMGGLPANDGHDNAIEGKHESIELAMLSLNDKQRAAVTLCYYDGLSQAEAADMMNLKLKAFESLLGRAKQKLKETAPAIWSENYG